MLEKYIHSQFKEVCETNEQKASSQSKTILVDPSSLGAVPKVSTSIPSKVTGHVYSNIE